MTFEPLLVENKDDSFLSDYSIVAVATVTQVMIINLDPELRGLSSIAVKVDDIT